MKIKLPRATQSLIIQPAKFMIAGIMKEDGADDWFYFDYQEQKEKPVPPGYLDKYKNYDGQKWTC